MRIFSASLPAVLALSLLVALSACKKEDSSSTQSALAPSGSPLAHTANILSFGPRPAGSKGAQESRNYVTSVLEKAGWTVGSQTTKTQTPIGVKTFTNLIARFPASPQADPWQQNIEGLLCAHLDSKDIPNKRFLGADDAASACGLILTIAQEMAADPAQASRMELIFFDGEEAFTENLGPKPGGVFDGLYGSRAYASRWQAAKEKPSFGILLDMVGHQNLQIRVPADSPKQLVAVMNSAAKKTGHSERFQMSTGSILDDHLFLNQAGIPTIDIIGDFGAAEWWHTPRDNLDLISADSLAITHEVVTTMLAELLASE